MAERLHPFIRFQRGEPVSISEIRTRSHGLIPTVRELITTGRAQVVNRTSENDFNYSVQMVYGEEKARTL